MINSGRKKSVALFLSWSATLKSLGDNHLGLLADTEFFLADNGTIALDVGADKIVEQATTFTNKHLKCALSSMIFFVDLKVFGQVGDTDRE